MSRVLLAAIVVLQLAPLAQAADPHSCNLAADRRSVTVTVSNPYAQETHCQVNCHFAGSRGGMISVSCGTTVPGSAKDVVLCTRTLDNNQPYGKFDSSNAECVKPLAQQKEDDKKDDDEEIDQDEILKRMQRGEKMENWLKKN